MKYSIFERLALAVGGIAVLGTIVSGISGEPLIEELVAQVLLLVVLVGAVHWGRNGGFITAIGASLVYIVMRVPLMIEEGLIGDVVELILVRVVTFGIVGILGGELCTRIKYIFASMEDANSLDPVTKVFNERFVGCRLRKCLAESERYGNHVSIVVVTLDPGLYLPLRRIKQRQVLRTVASHIRNDVRLVDDLGRLNDSRFLLVLPNTPREGAEVVSDRIRAGVRDLLGARDESVATTTVGTPEDVQALKDFLGSLDLREPEPVCSQTASG